MYLRTCIQGGLQVQMRGSRSAFALLPWLPMHWPSPAPFPASHPILCDEAFANDTGGMAMMLISWAMWGSIPYRGGDMGIPSEALSALCLLILPSPPHHPIAHPDWEGVEPALSATSWLCGAKAGEPLPARERWKIWELCDGCDGCSGSFADPPVLAFSAELGTLHGMPSSATLGEGSA